MRGSERQVAWATEIKERVSAILRDAVEEQRNSHPENVGNIKGFEAMLGIVSAFDGYAGEIIDIFQDIRCTGDIKKDALNVALAIRASRLCPEGSGELGKQLRALFGLK